MGEERRTVRHDLVDQDDRQRLDRRVSKQRLHFAVRQGLKIGETWVHTGNVPYCNLPGMYRTVPFWPPGNSPEAKNVHVRVPGTVPRYCTLEG